MAFLEFLCGILVVVSVVLVVCHKTYSSSVLQYDWRPTWMLGQEVRNIVHMGVEHNPAAVLLVVLCNFSSVDMWHCYDILHLGVVGCS